MTKEDWAAGQNRREKLLGYFTRKSGGSFNSEVKEDMGLSDEDQLSMGDKTDYADALANRATPNELADVFKKLNDDYATETGDWQFKYNPSFVVEEDIDKLASLINSQIDKLLNRLTKATRWNRIRDKTRELLRRFASYGGAIGTSVEQVQETDLDEILDNFTYRNRIMTTKILRKNRPLAISEIGISQDSNYFTDRGIISNDIIVLEKESDKWPNLETRLESFIRKLKALQTSGKDEIKTIHPDLLIGRIGLKNLESRKAIYKYWKEVHDDFNRYIDAQDELHKVLKEKLKILEEQEKDNENKEKIMSTIEAKLDSFFSKRLDKTDNYVIEVPSKNIDMDDKNVKAIILLSEFLKMYIVQAQPKSQVRFDEEEGEHAGTGEVSADYRLTGQDAEGRELHDPDVRIERDIIQPDKEERTLAEQATMEPTQHRIPKDTVTSILGDIKSIKSIQRVDPLFYYAWTQGAFGRVPMFKKDVISIKRLLKKKAARIDIFLEPSELDKLDDYFDKLYDAATDFNDTDRFYLPLTPKVADLSERDDANERVKKLKEHFDSLKDMMSLGGMKDKAWPTSAVTRQKTLRGQRKNTALSVYESTAGREKQGKNILDLFGDMFSNEYEEYMETLVEAFVIPLTSQYIPFDDEQEFVEEYTMRLFRDEMKNPDAFATLLTRYFELETAAVSVHSLKELTALMEEISKPALQRRLSNLTDKMDRVATSLEEIFNYDHDEDIYIHFGTILQEIKEKNNIQETIDFKGKTTAEWAKKYNSKKTYPLDALESHLRRHKSSYESDVRFKRDRVIRKFFAALDSFDIVKSNLEAEVLIAHDNIRKMLNKPVHYNTSKIDNYDHVNYAIEVAKEDYNVDLNATEVETIVNEFNSMSEIANKHGITQETVYFLKANFR